jgi:hypothetical protein
MPIGVPILQVGGNGYKYPHEGTLQRAGMPTKRESQARSCSKAKRVAAVRELTPILW